MFGKKPYNQREIAGPQAGALPSPHQHLGSAPSSKKDSQVNVSEIIALLYRVRWIGFFLAVVGAGVGWKYSQSIEPYFTTQSTVSISINRAPKAGEDGYSFTSKLSQQESDNMQLRLLLPTLASYTLAEKVLNQSSYANDIKTLLKIEKRASSDPNAPQYSTESLKKYIDRIKYQGIPDTNLTNLVVTTGDPSLSAIIANAHAEEFIKHVQEQREKEIAENNKFLKGRLEEVKKQLKDAEQELLDYARQKEIFLTNIEGGYTSTLGDVYGNLMTQLNSIVSERARLQSLLQEARRSKGTTVVTQSKDATALDSELRTMQSDYGRMLDSSSLKRDNPELRDLQKKIGKTRQQIQNLRKNAISDLEAQYEAAKRQESALRNEIEKVRDEGLDQSKILVNYNILSSKYKSLKELHEKLSQQLEDAYMAAEAERVNIVLVDRAVPPSSDFNRREPFYVAAGMVSALILAVGIGFLLSMLDSTIRSIDDLEAAIKIPALGVMPKYYPQSNKLAPAPLVPKQQAVENSLSENTDEISAEPVSYIDLLNSSNFSLSSTDKNSEVVKSSAEKVPERAQREICPQISNPYLVMIHAPRSPESEAVRNIRTSLILSALEVPPRSMLFTSAQKSEGKTTVTANVGISFAQDGARTILVDCDLRRPGLTDLFEMGKEPMGLSTYLKGQISLDEIIVPTGIDNLDMIPAGLIPENPAELLNSHRMVTLLRELAGKYEKVILDTPPVLPVTDCIILSQLVDGVVYVARSGKTTREVARRAVSRLKQVRATVLGSVLNAFDTKKRGYYYEYRDAYSYYGRDQKKSSSPFSLPTIGL